MEPTFYMVYSPNSGRGLTKTHPTPSDAQEEALRLCQLEGKAVYVLVTVGFYAPQPPLWHRSEPIHLVEGK